MGYKANVFKDTGYWIFACLGGAVVLALIDARDNILHGWFAGLFVIAGIASLVYYLQDRYRRTGKREKLRKLLPVFEAKRTEEIRRMVEAEPDFQTFCYECVHFNREKMGCTLHLYSRKMEIKLHPTGIHKYCLYWNVTSEPEVLKEVSPEFDGGRLW